MSTLLRQITRLLLLSFFFGCLVLLQTPSCSSTTQADALTGPFCAVERLAAPLLPASSNNDALPVAPQLIAVTIVATIVIASLVLSTQHLVSPHVDFHLVRFGPYQKRYPIILPSYQ